MAGRDETISNFERIGSQMGSTSQIQFQDEPRRICQEGDSLNSGLFNSGRPARLLDPIQSLPHEVSTFIIQDALPPNGGYSSQLLGFTSVSRIWRNFLLTMPVLWSEVYLDDEMEDFLATVATFISLSNEVDLKIAIYDRPMNGWADLLSILAPVHQRITSLTVLEAKFKKGNYTDETYRTISAISDFFDHLGHPPQLRELAWGHTAKPAIPAVDLLDLPSTVHLSGTITVPISPYNISSATPSRLFDSNEYESVDPTPLVAPLFRHCTLLLGRPDTYGMTVQAREEVLAQLKASSKYIDEATGVYHLEQFTPIIGTSLCHLEITVSLYQIDDPVNFLRLLTRLEHLHLNIVVERKEVTTEIAPSRVVIPQLRSFYISLTDSPRVPPQEVAQNLRKLFSALTPLYPGVESLTLWAGTWSFSASSYMESLRRLKYLHLNQANNRSGYYPEVQYDTENDPITLHYLEQLEVRGETLIHRLRTPNLLSLRLDNMNSIADLKRLGVSCLRKLTIHPLKGSSYTHNPSDFPVLSELELGLYETLKPLHVLSLSSLRSIRLATRYFTNPEGNHLCTALLYYPKSCPSLQELHFQQCLEWDILFLMLERRNFGLEGVKRIHTVTLPFVPFLINQNLTLLLTGETAVRPPLESISLEATREVLFDLSVPGCCRCLKNMVPGCMDKIPHEEAYTSRLFTADELYPEYSYRPDTLPGDIRDWMDYRCDLVNAWKTSYNQFRRKFARWQSCRRDM